MTEEKKLQRDDKEHHKRLAALMVERQSDSKQMWTDLDQNKHYILDGKQGSQQQVDSHGNKIRKYFNHLTGVCNYETRQEKVKHLGFPQMFAKVSPKANIDFNLLPIIMG